MGDAADSSNLATDANAAQGVDSVAQRSSAAQEHRVSTPTEERQRKIAAAQANVFSVPGVPERDAETLMGINYLSYGHGTRVVKHRGPCSKKMIERQLVHFDKTIRSHEDYQDLSSVYFGEDGFEEAQAQLEAAMKELCYERIRVVKGVRKRQLVRIYYVASKKIFSQEKGDDAAFNKKYPWAFE